MNNDSHTEERQRWLRELPMLGARRLQPGPDVHILTRAVYVSAALTDIRVTFAKARKALAEAA